MNDRTVRQLIDGQATSDGAGVRLFRVIGGAALPEIDPFLLLDEFVSDDPNDYIAGFPDHPHRGFETVTYMLAGRMRHQDNQGNQGLLEAGSVQWMTAGRGIVHSEMPEQENGLMWGFQLWVNLPAVNKLTAPRYQDIPPSEVPTVDLGGGSSASILAGTVGGISGPISAVDADPMYVDIELTASAVQSIAVPQSHTALVYCFGGDVAIGSEQPQAVGYRRLAVLSDGDRVSLTAGSQGARLLLIAGRPFNEPIARYGPFVMNTRDELATAVDDFRAGRF